jgi:NAD(P)-dependent dehydrogenase (short-subunit alcohol dehydrogenase family)
MLYKKPSAFNDITQGNNGDFAAAPGWDASTGLGSPIYPAYTASKHAVMGLTKVAALEYAQRGIRVNAVCHGIIHTPLFERYSKKAPDVDYAAMEPVGRIGEPKEVAEAMRWLCSDDSSFVTGTGLVVDGGFLAR